MTIRDFEPIHIIGKGAFGEVRVCRYKLNDEIVAIKKMKKDDMQNKNQILHVRAEEEVLSMAHNDWIVDLKFSFHDDYYLYLVMEFLVGGDLMSLLMAKDILPEVNAVFYAAQLVDAIDSVHKLNCIHRDIKPDNVLIGKDGHIKLSDFGLCKRVVSFLTKDACLYDGDSYGDVGKKQFNIISKVMPQMTKSRKKRVVFYSTSLPFQLLGLPIISRQKFFSKRAMDQR